MLRQLVPFGIIYRLRIGNDQLLTCAQHAFRTNLLWLDEAPSRQVAPVVLWAHLTYGMRVARNQVWLRLNYVHSHGS